MDLVVAIELPCEQDRAKAELDVLDHYPEWLGIVQKVAPEQEAWLVELGGRVGLLKMTKRVRMVRTVDEPDRVRFERQELDGREHAPWILDVSMDERAGPVTVTFTTVSLHYGGSRWLPGLDLLLAAEVRRAAQNSEQARTVRPMETRDKIFIDGSWVASTGTGTLDVINSATEEVMGRIPDGTAADVDKAARAAAAAFPAWSQTSHEERGKYIQRIVEGLTARMNDIATVISGEVGMPFTLSNMIQAGLPIMDVSAMTQVLDTFQWEEQVGASLVVREPVGVVGCITPWNYPLHQITAKVAPTLAARCTVVLKPSEVAPLNEFIFAEVVEEAGLPAGVFNLVTGVGPVVGEAIASHPLVDMVSFTGSTRAGKRVAQLAAETVKKVALELGGKSANVILDDADLARAIPDAVQKCYLNSGQTCSALTRLVVPRSRLAEVEELAAAATATYKVGDPFDASSRLGPLVSAAQRDRVRGYIQKGIDEGAKLVCGGAGAPEGLSTGFYVQPTVFSEVTPTMTIAQEEIFGPVLSILPYDTEEEAIEIANGTIYGLAGGVWAGTPERAQAVARRLRTGQVEVNGGAFNPIAPFGGYKQSGIGRELGQFGFEEFLETKALLL